MNHLEEAKKATASWEAYEAEGMAANAAMLKALAQQYVLLSIAESLERLASTVTPNSLEGYAGSISIDDGRG